MSAFPPLNPLDSHWKHVAESAGDGVWEWIIPTDEQLCSGRLMALLGFPQMAETVEYALWRERIHPDDRPIAKAALIAHLRGQTPTVRVEYRLCKENGDELWVLDRGMVLERDETGRALRMAGTITDITARKKTEQRERFRSQILEMLVSKRPLSDLLEAIAQGIESIEPDVLCSIHLIDREGQHLVRGASPSLPDFYSAAIDGVAIGPNVGSCGAAAASGERVIADNLLQHPNWASYREVVTRAGLAACWAQPIVSAAGVKLGSIGVYSRSIHTPGPEEIHLVEEAARLASLAIARQQADERLHLAASVFTHAREGILITDAQARIIDVNEAFTRITGYRRDEVLGLNPSFLSSGRQSREFYAAMWRDLLDKGYWQGEIWNRRANGEHYAEMKTISAVRDEQGTIRQYVSLFADITASKEHASQLEFNAHHDALTGLPNRVLLADRLQHAMAQARRRENRLAVIYMDLDGFKAVNDQHGHEVGDMLLMNLANRMRHVLRETDTLARLGGDEFVAVLPDLGDMPSTMALIQRLLAAAALPMEMVGLSLQVTASMGVTTYPQNDEVDADQLLRQADQAMYQAKLAGKNRFHLFDTDQDRHVRGQHESISQIRHALARREFVLHYQPKVNMRTGQVVGAEALIRWQHPERGLLLPGAFLPVIEDHPLAIELGEWVIDAALSQMDAWRAQGLAVPVSVNLGARQLQQADFVERMRALLAAHPDTPPGDLEMEVLETSALGDLARVSQVMQACHDLGVTFALDDFGTGYSSLTYLKRLPVALLKIDQSFVRDMLDDPDDLAILEGVLGLSKAFRRQVIAEGVETAEHGEMLLHLGCELAQGYGIARPMPADVLPTWVRTWKPATTWHTLPAFQQADTPLVVASLNHRAWMRALTDFLHQRRDEPPPLNTHDCSFGRWLGHALTRTDVHLPELDPIERVHSDIHELAQTLCQLHATGRTAQAISRLDEAHALSDMLLERLHSLRPPTQ